MTIGHFEGAASAGITIRENNVYLNRIVNGAPEDKLLNKLLNIVIPQIKNLLKKGNML
jgi:hypothetical protein